MYRPVSPARANADLYAEYAGGEVYDAKTGHRWLNRGFRRPVAGEAPFVEFMPKKGRWMQGDRVLPKRFKPKMYWARPVDGKRRGGMGRLKDALTGQGPDVFVVMNGDRRTKMRDMPHRAQWSRWSGRHWDVNYNAHLWDPDWTEGENQHDTAGWTDKRNWRSQRYNYQTRRYEGPCRRMENAARGRLWTDAQWESGRGQWGKNRRGDMPVSFRDEFGDWSTRVTPWEEWYPGARPIIP